MPTPTWAYATVADFKAYISGSVLSFDTTGSDDNDAFLLRLVESASRRVEQYVNRIWAPRTATVPFDLGRGSAHDDRLNDPFGGRFPGANAWGAGWGNSSDEWPDYWPGGFRSGHRVTLADWLLTATAVTSYADTARSVTQVFTQGIAGDYLLSPPDGPPYRFLVMNEDSQGYLGRGQQVLIVSGEWGWPYDLDQLTTLSAAITTTTATTFSAASAIGISAGQTLRIDAESLYVRAASPLTVRRGANGTTAATHLINAPISVIGYPSDLSETVLEIARLRYASRGQTVASVTADTGLTPVAYPGSEEKALLRRLDSFKQTAPKVHAF